MNNDSFNAMLSFKCDYCGVGPNVWCKTTTSRAHLHFDRFYKAKAAGMLPGKITKKETIMRRRELLEAQAKVVLEQLNTYAELDAKFGAEDEYPIDTVLNFDRVWDVDGRRYEFVALKVRNGKWYVTKGDNSRMGSPFTWEELKEFMKTSTKLYYASAWTAVFDDAQ